MDLTAIIGVIIGILLLAKVIGLQTGLRYFISQEAALVVLGGSLAATLVHFPVTQFFKVGGRLKAIFSIKKKNYQADIEQITAIAEKIKKDGRLSINKDLEKINDHFLKSSLQLFIDKVPPETLEAIMRENIRTIEDRHHLGILFFEQMAKYAPAFGMLGTLIGLVVMLGKLEDPKTIGPNMSLALVTTFYGVLTSNLIFMPLSGRLRISSQEEIFQKEMLLKGIVSMAQGESTYIIKEKMAMFLSEKDRKILNKKMSSTAKKS